MNVINGRGGLPMVSIQTPWSTGEIYLQGASVTHFQKHGEPPLLFLSEKSRFATNAPIRGGIPIVFPWFGKPGGRSPQHGFARNQQWDVVEISKQENSQVIARFRLPKSSELPNVSVEYAVTIGHELMTELTVTNYSDHDFVFENCLHTYFHVGDVRTISVRGLQGINYMDSLQERAVKQELAPAIKFTGEVDRIYFDSPQSTTILDPSLQRSIGIHTQNSRDTVVWNPWIVKSQLMTDFGDEEYLRMVCVESGNVTGNAIQLASGQESVLRATYSTAPS